VDQQPDQVSDQPARPYRLGGVSGKGFMPGQSGNPAGRPKGIRQRRTIAHSRYVKLSMLATIERLMAMIAAKLEANEPTEDLHRMLIRANRTLAAMPVTRRKQKTPAKPAGKPPKPSRSATAADYYARLKKAVPVRSDSQATSDSPAATDAPVKPVATP
jgi:hypothetical protein